MAATFHDAIDNYMVNVFTAMPGQIVSFDSATQTCSVQPVFKRKYVEDSEATPLAQIDDVPVLFPGGGTHWITFDVKVDSYVLLVFSQRDMGAWLSSGGVVDPGKRKLFDISDAIAIPGIWPSGDALSGGVESDAIELRNEDRTNYLKLDGTNVEINGSADFAVAYNDLKTAFDQLKSDLNTFITVYNAHTHAGVTAGGSSTATPSAPGSSSSADMSPAKVDKVKLP